MSQKFGRLALHMWTIDTTPLAPALDAAKQAGYDAVELRRTDFKRCFDAGMSNEQVLDLIKKSGIPCGVLGVEYGWLFATGEESRRLFKVFRESCENAVALGCDTLMSAPGQVNGVRRPTDRLPPGKGVVKWREMLGLLAEKEYTGYLSYEAPNPDQWARSPYDVASEGVELTRQLLRDAVPTYVS
jgi:sugar phosphate isomerase/epimerase